MKRITAARAVTITADDQREEHPEPVTEKTELAFLTERLHHGHATLTPGLTGWPPYTATLTRETLAGDTFHVNYEDR